MFALENQLPQRRKQNVIAICTEEDVISIRSTRHHANLPQDGQLPLHRSQCQVARARDLADIHLAARMMKQSAQYLRPNNRKK